MTGSAFSPNASRQPNAGVHHQRNSGYYSQPANSRHAGQIGARPSNRPSGYRTATRGGQSIGGRNLGAYGGPSQHHGGLNGSHKAPRRTGSISGFNVRNGFITPNRCGTILGSGINSYGYNGYRPFYGGGYFGRGAYYGGSCYGGSQWRYPLYSRGYLATDVVYGYDPYVYEGDVYEALSTDVISDEAAEEWEAAEAASEDRLRASVQDRALREFGAKYAEDDMRSAGIVEEYDNAPGETGVTLQPGVGEEARLIGISLGRGDKAFESGKYDQARAEYARALALAGEDSSSRIALGLADFALGSFGSSADAIRRGVARSPSLAMSDFDLRAAYGDHGDFETHRSALEAFASENPDEMDARFLLGFVRYFSGDRQGGIAELDAYLAAPDHDDSVREFINTARVAEHPYDR